MNKNRIKRKFQNKSIKSHLILKFIKNTTKKTKIRTISIKFLIALKRINIKIIKISEA